MDAKRRLFLTLWTNVFEAVKTFCGMTESSRPYFINSQRFQSVRKSMENSVKLPKHPPCSCEANKAKPICTERWPGLIFPGIHKVPQFFESGMKIFQKKKCSNGSSKHSQDQRPSQPKEIRLFKNEDLEKIENWVLTTLKTENILQYKAVLDCYFAADTNSDLSLRIVTVLQDFSKSIILAFDKFTCFYDTQDFKVWSKIKDSSLSRAKSLGENFLGGKGLAYTIVVLPCEKIFKEFQLQNERIVGYEKDLFVDIQVRLQNVVKEKLDMFLESLIMNKIAQENTCEALRCFQNKVNIRISQLLSLEEAKSNKVCEHFTQNFRDNVDKCFTEILSFISDNQLSTDRDALMGNLRIITQNILASSIFEQTKLVQEKELKNQIKDKCQCIQEFLSSGSVPLPRLVINNIKRDLVIADSVEAKDTPNLIEQNHLLDKIMEKYKLETTNKDTPSSEIVLCGTYDVNRRRDEFFSNFEQRLNEFEKEDFFQDLPFLTKETSAANNDILENLKMEIHILLEEVGTHEFNGHFTKAYRNFEATASKLLSDLDNVDYNNNASLRKWRSKYISKIQNLLDHLATLVHKDGKICDDCELKGTKWE